MDYIRKFNIFQADRLFTHKMTRARKGLGRGDIPHGILYDTVTAYISTHVGQLAGSLRSLPAAPASPPLARALAPRLHIGIWPKTRAYYFLFFVFYFGMGEAHSRTANLIHVSTQPSFQLYYTNTSLM